MSMNTPGDFWSAQDRDYKLTKAVLEQNAAVGTALNKELEATRQWLTGWIVIGIVAIGAAILLGSCIIAWVIGGAANSAGLR